MKKEEFYLLKEELTNRVIEYEILMRRSTFLNHSYLLEFKDELKNELYLRYENDTILQAIFKNSIEINIDEYLEECKNKFKERLSVFNSNVKQAEDMSLRCSHYTALDVENLDKAFAKYIKQYHPLIKTHITDMEKNLYNVLITIYRLGNIEGFYNILKENEDVLSLYEIKPEEYEAIAIMYKESLKNINQTIQKMLDSFPLNKENVFQSETAITQELGFLREQNYRLREANKSLHQDFLKNFGKDFEL